MHIPPNIENVFSFRVLNFAPQLYMIRDVEKGVFKEVYIGRTKKTNIALSEEELT